MMIVFLEIDNWTGMSLGAEHWYGQIVCGRHKVRLTRLIDAAEAAYLNKKNGYEARYRPGSITYGFVSIETLRENAVGCFRDHFPQARLLVESKDSLYPGPVLFGPPDVQAAAQALHDRMEAQYAGRSRPRSWKEHDAILAEWHNIVNANSSQDAA